MNSLTNAENLKKLSEREIELGTAGTKNSWHNLYKDSAWIFVGGLPFDLTEGDVICIFSQYGEIVNINMVRDKKTGKTKGYAFICYEDQRSTILAVDNFNTTKILQRTIRVDHVKDYKPPDQDDKNIDEVTKAVRAEGIAPRPLTPSDSGGDEEFLLPKKKKRKSEKKEKKKKKEKIKKEIGAEEKSDKKEQGRKEYRDVERADFKRHGSKYASVKDEKVDVEYNKYANSGRSDDRFNAQVQGEQNRGSRIARDSGGRERHASPNTSSVHGSRSTTSRQTSPRRRHRSKSPEPHRSRDKRRRSRSRSPARKK